MNKLREHSIIEKRDRLLMELFYKTTDTRSGYSLLRELVNDGGLSQTKAAALAGVSRKTVSRALSYLNTEGPKAQQGRPKKLTTQMVLHIECETIRDRRMPSQDLAKEISTIFNVSISAKTVDRCRKTLGFAFRPPINSVLLSEESMRKRVRWARSHMSMNWANVVFTDESYFQLASDKSWLWRKSADAGDDVRYHSQLHPEKVLIWGGIGLDYKTDLVILENTIVDEMTYICQIIRPSGLIETAAEHFGDVWYLQQDNARPHVSKFSTQQFADMRVALLDSWPPYSPDLNVIEVVWGIMKHRVSRRNPKSIEDLKRIIRDVWYDLSFQTINGLIRSMPARCQRVIDSDGKTLFS